MNSDNPNFDIFFAEFLAICRALSRQNKSRVTFVSEGWEAQR